MDQEIGEGRFLERGVKGFDELMRQLAHEADCVGEQQRLFVRQSDFARRGVEGGEEFVLDENVSAGEPAEERGFAHVGVADDGGVRHGRAFAVFPLGGAGAAHSSSSRFSRSICSRILRLSCSSWLSPSPFRTDAAALLSEVAPGPGEPRQRILPCARDRPGCGLRGVCARAPKISRMISWRSATVMPASSSQLRCCEGLSSLSKMSTSHSSFLGAVDDLLRLAGADQIARMVFAIGNELPIDDRNAERVDQFVQFLEQILRFGFLVRIECMRRRGARAPPSFPLALISNIPAHNLADGRRGARDLLPREMQ